MIARVVRAVVVSLVLMGVAPSVVGQSSENRAFLAQMRNQAAQGDSEAMIVLGFTYETGEFGVRQDYVEAVKWYRKAADQGDASGQNSLGNIYSEGEGVPQDDAEAVKWYRMAADQGYAVAQHNLGFMYSNGQGVPQDYVQAHLWYNLAGAGGIDKAVKNRNIVAAKMTPAQIAEAQKLAREWKPKKP